MKESYLFENSERAVDIVALALIDFFTFFFCGYWEPPGFLLPFMAELTLSLLTWYFFCNFDQEVLVNS